MYIYPASFVTVIIFLSYTSEAISSGSECGIMKNRNKLPWTIGIYLENKKDYPELVCLGTVLKNKYVITDYYEYYTAAVVRGHGEPSAFMNEIYPRYSTGCFGFISYYSKRYPIIASQCVSETLAKRIRRENIYVSKDIEKVLKNTSNAARIQPQNIVHPKEYEGFWLNPIGDLAVLKTEETSSLLQQSICVDWSDLTNFLQENVAGISSFWGSKVKTVNASFLNDDSCTTSTSEDFANLLNSDKHCFIVPEKHFEPQTIGSGIYYQNPKNGRWYLEGVISGFAIIQDEVFLAATSVRRYLSWLSHVCASS